MGTLWLAIWLARPAFFATQFVSYSRVQAKQHHWYDTLASSAIAAGYGYAVTTPFKKRYNITTDFSASPDGAYVRLSYDFLKSPAGDRLTR